MREIDGERDRDRENAREREFGRDINRGIERIVKTLRSRQLSGGDRAKEEWDLGW